jgi:hypothetical protein
MSSPRKKDENCSFAQCHREESQQEQFVPLFFLMCGEFFWLFGITKQPTGVTGTYTYWHVPGSEQKLMTNLLVTYKPCKQQKTQMPVKTPGVPYTPMAPIILVLR